ncbi:DUF3224 domain-containing protein [Amantichitinum ursilacus]|uniref:DUF3224 domain-containing protein n=1 Tax=Amantichitinum ursilacus TaxID=857265 RepID=A0A0N0XKB2_9NEIS|nr:DUF3224 domain-containing protein [Amantichitinum ursilacus]KPC54454.1 hypothetical protein WG78_02720 [Amantichitinum ursilacus]
MMTQATGAFSVSMTPTTPDADASPPSLLPQQLGRLQLLKYYSGDLQATGRGQMLTATTEVEGSAGYVAIEHVEGSLHGKRGSFVLQHSGTMARGQPQLSITIVPDSGTGDLFGISGRCQIVLQDGGHSYVLDYELHG